MEEGESLISPAILSPLSPGLLHKVISLPGPEIDTPSLSPSKVPWF